MEGKDAIINKIMEDAEKKSSSVIDKAKFEGSLLIKEAEKWASDYLDAQNEILLKQKDEIVSRRLTVAELDVRKIFLQKKQDLITEILDKIYLSLTKINKKDYLLFVEKLIIDNADFEDEIILSKDGVLNNEDISSLKVFCEKKLTVSNKKGDFIGGVFLVGKKADKDLTFMSIINRNKSDYISRIAEKLFD